jgi:uncharacterized protein YegP (UPF0339 family)
MPNQRPSLSVNATPVSSFVAPQAAAAELYDQQSVNLALQFSEAFKELSLSASNFYANLKTQDNKESLQKGIDLVNMNQKSYSSLVESGEIKPSENPWLAVGAQQASGTMEGMQARAHFMSLYDQQSQSDPKFFDNADGFNALAHQYTTNINTKIGDQAYLSRSFYEAFNPFIASASVDHEQKVATKNTERITLGVAAATAQGYQDLQSSDPIVKEGAMKFLQYRIDEMGRSGVSQRVINETLTKNVMALAVESDNPDLVLSILKKVYAGTAPIADTEYAQVQMALYGGKIEEARNRTSLEENLQIRKLTDSFAKRVASGDITVDQAQEDYLKIVTGDDRQLTLGTAEVLRGLDQIKTKSVNLKNETLSEGNTKFTETMATQLLNNMDYIKTLGTWQGDAAEIKIRDAKVEEMRRVAIDNKWTPEQTLSATDHVRRQFGIRGEVEAQQAGAVKALNQQTDDQVQNLILSATTEVVPGMEGIENQSQLKILNEERLKVQFKRMGLSAEATMKAIAQYRTGFDGNAKVREESSTNMAFDLLWKGGDGKTGISTDFDQKFAGQLQGGDVVDAVPYKMQIDEFLKTRGIAPESPEANKYYTDGYRKLQAGMKQTQDRILASNPSWSGTVNDLAADSEVVRAQKGNYRSNVKATTILQAMAFNNKEEQINAIKVISTHIGPQAEGNTPPEVFDYLKAFDIIGRNSLSWSNGESKDSPNGSYVHKVIEATLQGVRQGKDVNNSWLDSIQRLEAQRGSGLDYFDPKNPIGWTDLFHNGTDGEKIIANERRQNSDAGITNSDSYVYAAAVRARVTNQFIVENPGSVDQAIKLANAKIAESHIVVRGSLIPRDGLPNNQGADFVAAWSDAMAPGRKATLIPIYKSGDQTFFALRDPQGNAIAGMGLFTKNDMVINAKIVKQMQINKAEAEAAVMKKLTTDYVPGFEIKFKDK